MAVVGIGGVGSVTAEMLTRCGVGKVGNSWYFPFYLFISSFIYLLCVSLEYMMVGMTTKISFI